ncbi:MAG TPA: hypothetical protein VFS21_29880 [Roseiflexaceae bacterium]|nr:hypothetical protein [Roseiflexaceae bacterium]
MTDVVAGRLIVEVEGRDLGLDRLLRVSGAALQRTDQAARQATGSIGRALQEASARSRGAIVQEEQALASAQRQMGNYAGSIQRLLAIQDSGVLTERQSISVTRQLISTRQAAIREIEREAAAREKLAKSQAVVSTGGAPGALSALSGALGGLGLAFSAQGLVSYAQEAINSANSLEKTEATVRALSGSQERYNEVLKLAQDGQKLYGGSLEGNLKGLGSLVNLANRAGVSLQQLDNIGRRLSVAAPEQGPEGVGVALKEFLSGDNAEAARSLIERFELSPELKRIAASGASASEKVAALDAELTKLGISQDVLTNRADTTAAAYDRLGATLDNIKTKAGSALAQSLQPLAENADRVLAAGDQKGAAEVQAFAGAKDYEDYRQRIAMVDQQLNEFRATAAFVAGPGAAQLLFATQQLTQSEFEYAQALMRRGVAQQQAFQQAQQMQRTIKMVDLLREDNETTPLLGGMEGAQFDQLAEQILRVAAASPEAAARVNELISTFRLTGDMDAFTGALQQMDNAQQAAARSAIDSAAVQQSTYGQVRAAAADYAATERAIRAYSEGLDEEAAKSLISGARSEELRQRKQSLEQQAQATANRIIAAGGNIEAQAARLAASSGLVDQLTAAFLRLAAAQQAAKQETAFGNAQQDFLVMEGNASAANVGKSSGPRSVAELNAQTRAAAAARERELVLAQARGENAKVIGLLRQQQQGLNKDSLEYAQIEARIIGLQRSGRGGGGGGGGAARVSQAQKTAGQLEDVQIKADQKAEDEELKHQKRRMEIVEDFAEKRLEAEERYQTQTLESRAGFYDGLANIKDQGVAQAASAEYEKAAQEAQQIAATAGADVAERYLTEQERVIQDRARRAEKLRELQKIVSEGQDGRGEAVDEDRRASAASELEYLQGVENLRRAAEERRLQQARDTRKSLAEQEQQALNDENMRYEEAQGKIADTAERSADAKIRAAQRSQKASAAELETLRQISKEYERQGQRLPTTGPAAPAAGGATASPATPTTPAASATIPATGSDAGNLAEQLGAVVAGLADVATKVAAVERAVRSGADQVSGAVASRSMV